MTERGSRWITPLLRVFLSSDHEACLVRGCRQARFGASRDHGLDAIGSSRIVAEGACILHLTNLKSSGSGRCTEYGELLREQDYDG